MTLEKELNDWQNNPEKHVNNFPNKVLKCVKNIGKEGKTFALTIDKLYVSEYFRTRRKSIQTTADGVPIMKDTLIWQVAVLTDDGILDTFNIEFFEVVEADESQYFDTCSSCLRLKNKVTIININDKKVCPYCVQNYGKPCYNCKQIYFKGEYEYISDKCICNSCKLKITDLMTDCTICNNKLFKIEDKKINNLGSLCSKCGSQQLFRTYSDVVTESQNRFKNTIISPKETSFNVVKSERSFGVEFEVESKDYLRIAIKKTMSELSSHVVDKRHTLVDFVEFKQDASLDRNCGVEIVTSPLRGDKGREILEKICNILKKYFNVSKRCGLHIHIGVEDYYDDELPKLYYIYQQVQKIFNLYVPEYRLEGVGGSRQDRGGYCRKMPQRSKVELLKYFEKIKRKSNVDDCEYTADLLRAKETILDATDRYRAVNFASIRKHGTIEIRLMDGTTDYDRIIEWIILHQRVVDYTKENSDSITLEANTRLSLKTILGEEIWDIVKNKKEYNMESEENVSDTTSTQV